MTQNINIIATDTAWSKTDAQSRFSQTAHSFSHEVADAGALKELRARYPCLAFEAEPRWVSHTAHYNAGYCGRRSQWATVLTITASADARSPTSVTTMTTEERAREARTERERALRAELDRARLGEE